MIRGAAFLLSVALSGPVWQSAAAQTDSASRLALTTITGIVRDSIADEPLSGAIVQLVGANSARVARTTVSDSLGRFNLDSVPPGRYSLGFFHPILESLGIEPPLRELSLSGERRMRSDLGTPSAERFRQAVCGPKTTSQPGAVVVGIVRDARDLSAVSGVIVTGEWLELTFTHEGMRRSVPRVTATTSSNGWFAMCDVPSSGTIFLSAGQNADSVGSMELSVPANGVLSEELYLGPAPAVAVAQSPDSVASHTPEVRTGDGHLSGTVVAVEGGRPLPGARVGIVGGPQTRANERGEWTLGNSPTGTRMLEVRAVGYYPERRPVNVIPGAPPVKTALATLRAVLDTIKVSATRLALSHTGFEDRRRTGAGKYMTAEDVARRGGVFTSNLFRTMPGMTVERDSNDTPIILMRGPFGYCSPTIFINGMRMPGFTGDDIDNWISPKEIAGIEIYSEASAPPQFRDLTKMDVCGSIVIWKRGERP